MQDCDHERGSTYTSQKCAKHHQIYYSYLAAYLSYSNYHIVQRGEESKQGQWTMLLPELRATESSTTCFWARVDGSCHSCQHLYLYLFSCVTLVGNRRLLAQQCLVPSEASYKSLPYHLQNGYLVQNVLYWTTQLLSLLNLTHNTINSVHIHADFQEAIFYCSWHVPTQWSNVAR